MKNILTFLVICLSVSPIISQENFQKWDNMLKTYVDNNGLVDYQNWAKSKNELNLFLDDLSKSDLKFSSAKEEMVFWMNLYNAATIKKVLDNYPISSIKEISGGKVWDEKFISVSNQKYSLNQIENDILRKKFKDPRIHFGVNCAAISCPKLHNSAFEASSLDATLNKLSTEFINRSTKVKDNYILVSRIFEWYKVDFIKHGTLIDYLNKYMNKKIPTNSEVKYSEYNWGLNRQ